MPRRQAKLLWSGSKSSVGILLFLLGTGLFGKGVLAQCIAPVCQADSEKRQRKQGQAGRLDFSTRILPLLTKAGCNTGTCHGAAIGQGGFRLSLLGYDPESDYHNVTQEFEGRRIHREAPDESLLLRKATNRTPHGGGPRLRSDSAHYKTLRAWLAAGAAFGSDKRRVTRLVVTPDDLLLPRPNASQPLRVTAHYSDGAKEDVTALALYTANDDAAASVTPAGVVTLRTRGLTSIMVRYLGQVAAVRLAVPYRSPNPPTPFPTSPRSSAGKGEIQNSELRTQNSELTSHPSSLIPHPSAAGGLGVIDNSVRAELARLGLPASPLADDSTFLRRVFVDVIGTLPNETETRAFLADKDTEKRAKLIDRLLARGEFTDFWTLQFADLLLINSKRLGREPARAYYNWLHSQIAANTPYDRIVTELVTAQGNTAQNGAANFYRVASDPRDIGEAVSRTLLGVRVQCARCHNHPFDRWTQDDYYRFSALFARVRFSGNSVVLTERGEIPHPKTGKDVLPAVLGKDLTPNPSPGSPLRGGRGEKSRLRLPSPRIGRGAGGEGVRGEGHEPDRRRMLAEWLTDPKNPRLAEATVNRVWKHLLGRGIIEPVDDLRATNPPSNPALLRALVADFIQSGYDLRHLIRTIVSSETYQRSSRTNAINRHDDKLFSHAFLKPLRAHVLADAVAQVTGVPDTFPEQPAAKRALQLIDSQTASYALDVFGRCPRDTNCENPTLFGGGLAQALHLINGASVNDRLRGGILDQLLSENRSEKEIVESLYLRAFSRFPTAQESAHWERTLKESSDRREAVEDLLWALLNSREFAYSH